MLAVVIVLGALIVIALVLLVVGMMRKFSEAPGSRASSGATTVQSAFALPPGAKVIEMQSESGRLIRHVRTGNADEIDIVDTEDGHLISQIKAAN